MYRYILLPLLLTAAFASARETRNTGTSSVVNPLPSSNMYAPAATTTTTSGSAVWQQPQAGDVALDAVAFGGILCGKDDRFSSSTLGLELMGSKYFTKRQALTLSLLGAVGGDTSDFLMYDSQGRRYLVKDYTRADFALMAGYRFTQPIGSRMYVSVGAKAGLDVQYLGFNEDDREHWNGNEWVDEDEYDTFAAGFTYAGCAEIGFRISEEASITIGYQFRGATTRPEIHEDRSHPYPASTKSQMWHEIRIGVSGRF